MSFVINELAQLEKIAALPGYEEIEADLVNAVLEEASRLATEVLAPLNQSADRNGARIEGSNVAAPQGFAEAYRQFAEGGWASMPFSPDIDGQGMPALVTFAVDEMWNATNMSFALCPMLTQAGVEALERHGTARQKKVYMPKLVSGEWTGTMDLTEPQAGSDLAAIRCKAVPKGDHYRVSGQKIYITWGDHGMTDNIIHMVLARTPDAPDGVRGISLFMVPKYIVNDDGSLGPRNDMRPMSIEHKLGIHGSPTCVMGFGENDGAIGYLVGEENKGLACMFTMMNNARLKVGLEGLGLSEGAYQRARNYAADRIQGSAPGQPGRVAIINHPDVRRMLMLMKSQTEAIRALAYTTAASSDIAEHSSDRELAVRHKARVDLMVPIVKAWSTEQGQEVSSLGVQVHGGMGYVEETGAAQYFRDARITTIYEGTTGIQGQDLAGRKIIGDEGKAARELLDDIAATVAEARASADNAVLADQLAAGADSMRASVDWLLANYSDDAHAPNAVCVNLLMLMGTVTGAWQLARAALIAQDKLAAGAPGSDWYRGKIATARFFLSHMLPRAHAYRDMVLAGSDDIMALDIGQF